MFSSPLTFAPGRLGAGLLLARTVVAGEVVALAMPLGNGAESIALVVAAALVCGVATRTGALMAVLAAVWGLAQQVPAPALHLLGSAVPLAMTGPGAWSVDARLFGRRFVRLRRGMIGGVRADDRE